MGCNQAILHAPKNIQSLLKAIESSTIKSLNRHLTSYLKTGNIDEEILIHNSIHLNSLGYALYTGNTSSFIYIHQTFKASIKSMEELFSISNISSLHIICKKNYIKLLQYYLPYYLLETTQYPDIETYTSGRTSSELFPNPWIASDAKPNYLPIHIATQQANIGLLSFIFTYFKDKSYVPKLLDLEYPEENTGENCVLIACRMGNYKLILFFHRHCKLNFRVKNLKGMNAINVLVEGSRRKKSDGYLNCLRYLVEIVGLDIEYMHFASLVAADQPEIVKYLQGKLKEIGVVTTKAEALVGLKMMSFGVSRAPDLSRKSKYFREKVCFSEGSDSDEDN